jgi:hypothetical protein
MKARAERIIRIGFLRLACVLIAFAGSSVVVAQEKRAFFGDLHIHTLNSADAFLFNSRVTPDDAYRYAKGGSIKHPGGFDMRLTGGALDFAAVTDHGELLGVLSAMSEPS